MLPRVSATTFSTRERKREAGRVGAKFRKFLAFGQIVTTEKFFNFFKFYNFSAARNEKKGKKIGGKKANKICRDPRSAILSADYFGNIYWAQGRLMIFYGAFF